MRQAIHVLQHFYMLPILSLYWISSILNPTCITVTVAASPILPLPSAPSGPRLRVIPSPVRSTRR